MLECVKETVTEEGPGWKTEPPGGEPGSASQVVGGLGQGQSPSCTLVLTGVPWADQHLDQYQSIYQRCK